MLLQLLKNLGFSDVDIKIYEGLLSQDSRKDELMTRLNIDEKSLEESINRLKQIGAIDVRDDIIILIHPNNFLNNYLKMKELELSLKLMELKNTINEVGGILSQMYDERRYGIRKEELWQYLNSLIDMELETVKIISRAKDEVLIFTEKFSYYPRIREELLSAKGRGVRIKIIFLNPSSEDIIRELKINKMELRHFKDWRNIRFTIIDNREAVFLIWARKSGGDRIFYRPGYTRNPGIIEILSDTFAHLWEKALPL